MTCPIRTTFAVLLLAIAAAPPAAYAEGPARISVKIEGIDMTQPASGAFVLSRIRAAARSACLAPGYNARQTTHACMSRLISGAVSELDIPSVTAALGEPERPVQLASR